MRHVPVRDATPAAVVMGAVAGHGKRRGTSGEVVQRTKGVRDAMREKGINGRWIQACQGHCVGLGVSSTRKTSGPRNSRTANAP